MGTASIRELRNETASLLQRAEEGEVITITNHGRPVAELRALDREPAAIHPKNQRLLERLERTEPYDSGMADWLADDRASELALERSWQ